MTVHAEPRNTQSATEQMQPHLERTARELADIDRQAAENQARTTQRS